MNNIQPKYVTFKQAVWLKSIGFKNRTDFAYHVYNQKSKPKRYVGYKTNANAKQSFISSPEQSEALDWLLVNKGIYVEAPFWDEKFRIKIVNINTLGVLRGIDFDGYNTPQEAYSVAFDYIKENNLI
jgi:hypothetical protein